MALLGSAFIVPGAIMTLYHFIGVDGSTSSSSKPELFTSTEPYHGVSYLPTRGSEYDKRFNAALASTYGLKIVERGTDNVGLFNEGNEYILVTDLHGDNARKCEQKVISTTDTTQHVAIICNGTEAKKVKAS